MLLVTRLFATNHEANKHFMSSGGSTESVCFYVDVEFCFICFLFELFICDLCLAKLISQGKYTLVRCYPVTSVTTSWINFLLPRSSRSHMFFKIGVLKNFAIFKEKHLLWSLFLIKMQAFRYATSLKPDCSNAGVSPL